MNTVVGFPQHSFLVFDPASGAVFEQYCATLCVYAILVRPTRIPGVPRDVRIGIAFCRALFSAL
jgi:hypothetical protein